MNKIKSFFIIVLHLINISCLAQMSLTKGSSNCSVSSENLSKNRDTVSCFIPNSNYKHLKTSYLRRYKGKNNINNIYDCTEFIDLLIKSNFNNDLDYIDSNIDQSNSDNNDYLNNSDVISRKSEPIYIYKVVYQGLSRKKAKDKIKLIYTLFDKYNYHFRQVYMEFNKPNYSVILGEYITMIEAQELISELKDTKFKNKFRGVIFRRYNVSDNPEKVKKILEKKY